MHSLSLRQCTSALFRGGSTPTTTTAAATAANHSSFLTGLGGRAQGSSAGRAQQQQQRRPGEPDGQQPHQQTQAFDQQQPSSTTNRNTMSSRRTDVQLPQEVRTRLGTLKSDLFEALLDRQVASSLTMLADNPLQFTRDLQEMAKYYFGQSGKLIRPTISLLMSAACNQHVHHHHSHTTQFAATSSSSSTGFPSEANSLAGKLEEQISQNQYRIAIVAEMIHNSTLVHDDVIDESDTRRGLPTANARWGNKQAVLVGDFILARATKVLCSIGQPPVIETMAAIVEDLVRGELMQLNAPVRHSASDRFQHYMIKTFYKTGSLFANSCKSVAMLADCDESAQRLATEFGRNLGLAFQLVDDVLDYVASAAQLGKPTATDLRLGLATCPVLFAAQEYPELDPLIERRFSQQGDIECALELVHRSKGLQSSRELAMEYGQNAIENMMQLLPGGGRIRDCLVDIVQRQLERDR